jgi:hypothetical protein
MSVIPIYIAFMDNYYVTRVVDVAKVDTSGVSQRHHGAQPWAKPSA